LRRKPKATEQYSFQEALAVLSELEPYYRKILGRVNCARPLPKGAAVADIGAGYGLLLIACARLGYNAVGVEPWIEAHAVAKQLAEHEGLPITIVAGVAENVPLPSEQFDAVISHAVVEHVQDPQAAFNEAFRILKPGGIYLFVSASSMCPRQNEIRGFPLFGWYPDRLKRRIMEWAKTHKPHLIGHTQTPAINWFTPWKAKRMLRKAGFKNVLERWDLIVPTEKGRMFRLVLRLIRLCGLTRRMADVLNSCCAYAALK